jgi:tetratricopeptide (TPR) repeat protein
MQQSPKRLLGLGAILFAVAVITYVALGPASDHARPGVSAATRPTDFDIELTQLDAQIREVANGAADLDRRAGNGGSAERATRLTYLLYRRAGLTGDPADFRTISAVIDDALRPAGPTADLCLLKANWDFKFHQIPQAKKDLEMAPALVESAHGQALLADIAFQEGRYADAGQGYDAVVRRTRTWDNLARLAYFKDKLGDPAGADRTYAQAADVITAKEMRSYAWVELQRGLLSLGRGRYAAAADHYDRAGRAYSGYWLVDEHVAELCAARGRFDDAVALYQRVITRAPRPEVQQQFGDLYAFIGKPDLAKPWHDKALAGYLESADRGDVHYFHHLAAFYADVAQDGREAVKWATRDVELRRNYATEDALAWALYRDGQTSEALGASGRALAYGISDAHLFFHAAMIHLAAGRTSDGQRLLRQTAEVNPGYKNFHVHR